MDNFGSDVIIDQVFFFLELVLEFEIIGQYIEHYLGDKLLNIIQNDCYIKIHN